MGAHWPFHPHVLFLHTRTHHIMAGGLIKYRHLSRSSSHRKALLRNLVTSLIEHESIPTTWHKAKEAQRLAEKMITLGKKNTEASKRQALKFFFVRDIPPLCGYVVHGRLTRNSDRTKCFPSSLGPFARGIWIDRVATHACYA